MRESHGRDQIGLRVANDSKLCRVIPLRVHRSHQVGWTICIAPRPDGGTDDQGNSAVELGAECAEQLDGFAISFVQRFLRIAETRPPIRAGPPRHRFENEADAGYSGDARMPPVVASEDLGAALILQQNHRGEIRQLKSLVEDQVGLHAAISEEDVLGELGKAVSVPGHASP